MINVLGSLPTLILDFTHKQTNRGKNMSKVMQPIRTHELNHWSNVVREQFGHRKKSLETELFQEVKDKSKQMQPNFNKKIKVEAKLEQLRKAEKALNDFVSNKEKVERELQLNVAILVEQLRNDLKNWNEIRQWDNSDCNSLKSLSAIEEYLEEVCYEETKEAYMKSGWRHFIDWWRGHRGLETKDGIEEAMMALLFNVMGYAHEYLKEKRLQKTL